MRTTLILLILLLTACNIGGEPGSAASIATPLPVATAVATTSTTIATAPTRIPAGTYDDLEIITLLPPDAIPAIDDPQFLGASEAAEFYDPDELVMGVTFNGETRAYSVPFLSSHEIVNDTVGGVKIAVTW